MKEMKELKETEILDKVVKKIKVNKIKVVVYLTLAITLIFVIMMFSFILRGRPYLTAEEEINIINHVEFDNGEQFDDGILLDIQEINIERMKSLDMNGAEVVIRIMEQFVDESYRFVSFSDNYILPVREDLVLLDNSEVFVVVLAGYTVLNNLIYAQVFYEKRFFFIIIAREEKDIKNNFTQVPLTHMVYDKFNNFRRRNVINAIQRNNIIHLGVL